MDEHQKTLVDFITNQMSAVRDPDNIYDQLKSKGWPEDQIRQAFLALHTQVLPKAVREQAEAPSAPVPTELAQQPPRADEQPRGQAHSGWASLKRIFTKGRHGSDDKTEDDVHPAPPA